MPDGRNKNAQAGYRLPRNLTDKIRYIALRELRSATKLVELVLTDYVDEWEIKNGIIPLPNRSDENDGE